jgi:hypothetical protein
MHLRVRTDNPRCGIKEEHSPPSSTRTANRRVNRLGALLLATTRATAVVQESHLCAVRQRPEPKKSPPPATLNTPNPHLNIVTIPNPIHPAAGAHTFSAEARAQRPA